MAPNATIRPQQKERARKLLQDLPEKEDRKTRPEAAGLRHLAFYTDDVEAAAAELREKGIAVEPVRMDEFSHRKFTFFADPDGLPLELHE